jgi:NADH:ubiquinone oxidoreductase subunit 6 (subunit J)
MGSIRASAQMISYELALTLSVVAVLLPVGSLRLTDVAAYQQGFWLAGVPRWNVLPQCIGCLVFLVASFAETNRLPFDLPEAESELVAGHLTEYGGMRWAIFFMGEYMRWPRCASAHAHLGGWSWASWAHGAVRSRRGLTGLALLAAKIAACFFVWARWTFRGSFTTSSCGWDGRCCCLAISSSWPACGRGTLMEIAIFLLFAATALVSAVVVIAHRNPVYATMSLVVTLVATAGLFLMLGSPFLAALQVLLYTGAILVLFLFVIMLLNVQRERARRRPGAVLGRGGLVLVGMLAAHWPRTRHRRRGSARARVASWPWQALRQYLLPFEIIGLLLLRPWSGDGVARRPSAKESR